MKPTNPLPPGMQYLSFGPAECVPRVFFPGVVSGVDYDAMIEMYDALSRSLTVDQAGGGTEGTVTPQQRKD